MGRGNSELRIRFSRHIHLADHSPRNNGPEPGAASVEPAKDCSSTGVTPQTPSILNEETESTTAAVIRDNEGLSRSSETLRSSDIFTSSQIISTPAQWSSISPSQPFRLPTERLMYDKCSFTRSSEATSPPPLFDAELEAMRRRWEAFNRTGSHEPWMWPLTGHEARLVKHFFRVLIPWYDYCNDQMHFRKFIQDLLCQNPCILFGVLALAARLLEAMGLGNHGSNEYEHRCFEILIPTIGEAEQVSDDAVLVSALLLRLLDEMTGTIRVQFVTVLRCQADDAATDPDDRRSTVTHVVSAPLLLRMRENNPEPSDLSDAAMVVALRQEIVVANMNQRPVELTARDCNIDDSLDPAPYATWTLRMISHAAKITNYAYGHSHQRTESLWGSLWSYLSAWDLARPASFRPLNNWSLHLRQNSSSPSSPFPEIYHTDDCHLAAHQYSELCKILLLAYDPQTPAVGLGRGAFLRKKEAKMRDSVRIICGVYVSNSEVMSTLLTAGLAIALAGELFGLDEGQSMDGRNREQREAEIKGLLEIVTNAERHVGWPCLKVGAKLREFWGLGKGS